MILEELYLTPISATAIFVVAVVAGHRYRRVWRSDGPLWQLWLYGCAAALCLLIVGFLPLRPV